MAAYNNFSTYFIFMGISGIVHIALKYVGLLM